MITVVIPTYNERDTIGSVVEALFALPLSAVSILVIDDNSPDGTADVVRGLQSTHTQLELIVRPEKTGLGPAYVAGFRQALATGAEIIVQMDADGSHDPAYLPALLAGITETQADVVLGSRYVTGGGVRHWHWFRQLISRMGNVYARWMLRLPYHDVTGGYKVWRRSALEAIDLSAVSSTGYNFQIETTLSAHRAGFRIVERPIIFTERRAGASKFSGAIIWESVWKIFQLHRKG